MPYKLFIFILFTLLQALKKAEQTLCKAAVFPKIHPVVAEFASSSHVITEVCYSLLYTRVRTIIIVSSLTLTKTCKILIIVIILVSLGLYFTHFTQVSTNSPLQTLLF